MQKEESSQLKGSPKSTLNIEGLDLTEAPKDGPKCERQQIKKRSNASYELGAEKPKKKVETKPENACLSKISEAESKKEESPQKEHLGQPQKEQNSQKQQEEPIREEIEQVGSNSHIEADGRIEEEIEAASSCKSIPEQNINEEIDQS